MRREIGLGVRAGFILGLEAVVVRMGVRAGVVASAEGRQRVHAEQGVEPGDLGGAADQQHASREQGGEGGLERAEREHDDEDVLHCSKRVKQGVERSTRVVR
jgi:hypothetical protein